MTPKPRSPLTPIERAAVAWWEAHRPLAWTLAEHLETPGINCAGRDRILALAVAALVREKSLDTTGSRA